MPFAVQWLKISGARYTELVNRLEKTHRCRTIDRAKLRSGFGREGEDQDESFLRIVSVTPEDFLSHFI